MAFSTSQNSDTSQSWAWFKGTRFDYEEPARMCFCTNPIKAPMWVSKTKRNPGRRFFCCAKGRNEGRCQYFEWFDEEFTPWSAELINGLMRDKSRLKRELKLISDYGCEECKEARISQKSVIESLTDCVNKMEAEITMQNASSRRLRMLLAISWIGFLVYLVV